jgi:hypothetical protein
MLLNLLVKDRDLIGHLRSMKKYFLMEQGSGELTYHRIRLFKYSTSGDTVPYSLNIGLIST